MRGAVESRRLVQLDGVNANGVVAVAWIISSFMASLAEGASLVRSNCSGAGNSDEFVTLSGGRHSPAPRRRALLRSLPIAAAVAVLIGVTTTVLQGYIPPNSFWNAAVVPRRRPVPSRVASGAVLILPGNNAEPRYQQGSRSQPSIRAPCLW